VVYQNRERALRQKLLVANPSLEQQLINREVKGGPQMVGDFADGDADRGRDRFHRENLKRLDGLAGLRESLDVTPLDKRIRF